MKFGADGQLYAVNPEAGFFGVAPGTGLRTNPNAIDMISKNTIFTNVARTDDGDIWWEGMTGEPPEHAIDWRGNDWTPASDTPAAHPNGRFTVPAAQCPSIAAEWEDPRACRSRRSCSAGAAATVVPLVHEARDWEHGVFLGAIMSSETTAAQAGEVGKLRFDPMAMLPFCGYHMGDYFGHWLRTAKHDGAQMPRVFYVNWFRKDEDGQVHVARIRRELTRAGLGVRAGRGPRAGGRDPDRAGATGRRGRDRHAGLDVADDYDGAAARGRRRGLAGAAAAVPRSISPSSASKLPSELHEQLHGLESRLRSG